MDFYKKYFKYKTKYLNLKNQIGGDKLHIFSMKGINLIKDKEMEEYLNPINGFIMDQSKFISNNYFLHKANLLKTNESHLIFRMCKVTSSLEITNKIYDKITPRDFGRFITLLYCNYKDIIYKHKLQLKSSSQKLEQNFSKTDNEEYKCLKLKLASLKQTFSRDEKILESYYLHSKFEVTDDIGKDIKKNKIIFHILLFCLWWILNDKKGVRDYYLGINDTLSIINKYVSKPYSIIEIPENYIKDIYNHDDLKININNIDDVILVLAKSSLPRIKIFDTNPSSEYNGIKFPDCGEVTVRNFINLLIFNGINFDIDKLKQHKFHEKVIEYYECFDDFTKQSSNEQIMFDGKMLSARNAWNAVLFKYASNDVRLGMGPNGIYDDGNGTCNINPGLCKKNDKHNIFRVIQNLLPSLTEWSKLNEMDLKLKFREFIPGDENGTGTVYFNHEEYGMIRLVQMPCHFSFSYIYSNPNRYTGERFKNIVNQSTSNFESINFDNYLMVNYDSTNAKTLVEKITDLDLYIKVIELICANQEYTSYKTNRLNLIPDSYIDAKKITKNLSSSLNYNNIFFTGINFNFVQFIPNLETINWKHEKDYNKLIDYSPLVNIKNIGPNFMSDSYFECRHDITPLTNLVSVWPDFLEKIYHKIKCTEKQKCILLKSNPNFLIKRDIEIV